MNSLHAIRENLTPDLYVDNAIDERALLENLKIFFSFIILHITLVSEPTDFNHAVTKSNIGSPSENHRNRRHLSTVFNDHFNEFDDDKLTNSARFTVNRNPPSDSELSINKYFDDELDENTFLRFNQTLQSYLKVSVGNNVYHQERNNKI